METASSFSLAVATLQIGCMGPTLALTFPFYRDTWLAPQPAGTPLVFTALVLGSFHRPQGDIYWGAGYEFPSMSEEILPSYSSD